MMESSSSTVPVVTALMPLKNHEPEFLFKSFRSLTAQTSGRTGVSWSSSNGKTSLPLRSSSAPSSPTRAAELS